MMAQHVRNEANVVSIWAPVVELFKEMQYVIAALMRSIPRYLQDPRENFPLKNVMRAAIAICPQHF
jgi:hypothetical protein